MSNWKRRISISIAALLATGSTATAATTTPIEDLLSPIDDDNRIDAANGDDNNSLCSPNYGTGKFAYGNTFTIRDENGTSITEKTGLTFEVRGPNDQILDVTQSVLVLDDVYGFDDVPLGDLLPVNPLANIDPIRAPGLFGLGCQTTSNGNTVAFPSGTSLVALRDSSVVAIADISNRNIVELETTGLSTSLGEAIDENFLESCITQDLSMSATEECDPFTRVYSTAINLTDQRLHPFLAHFITIIFGIVHDQIDLNNGTIDLGMEDTTTLSTSTMSTSGVSPFNGVTPDECLDHLDSFVNVIEPPSNGDPGTYELTQAGEDFANSLSDPSVTSWPAVDSCFENYTGDPQVDEDDLRQLAPIGIIFLYFTQLLSIDIPLGNVASSLGGPNDSSLPFRLTAPTPPQDNSPVVTTTTPPTTTTTPVTAQSVRKKSQTLPKTGSDSSDDIAMALLLLAAGVLITLGRRRRQA
jgi:LPXTG-motif cell wall-anchored protein